MSDVKTSAEVSQQRPTNPLLNLLYRPPFVGLLAFVVVFLVQGLGHTLMVGMEALFGEEYIYQSAFGLGAVGAVLLYIGMRHPGEVAGTWYGFWAGSLLWTGWIEFSFVWSANVLNIPDLMDPRVANEIATKAEYLVMMSSVGILLSTLAYFTLNRETKCNMFIWFQRNLKLCTGKPTRGYERNFAAITALETVYVTWFCYLALLFIYDEQILGDHHPATFVIFFLNTIWAIFLFMRLIKMWKVTTAIRYSIPTAIIAYSSYEIAGRWHLFTDIWVDLPRFGPILGMIAVAMTIGAWLAVRVPAHKKAELSRDQLAAKTLS
jgi:hypothetical protein